MADQAAQADQGAQDEAARLAAELIRIDTTNRGGGDARERPAAEYVAAALAEDPQAQVVPYCMGGGTDAKHFSRLGIAGYGFTPLALPPGYDYHAMFHGVDERVPVSALRFGVRVMTRLVTGAGLAVVP